MSAVTRWVEYEISKEGTYSAGGAGNGKGTRKYIEAEGAVNKSKFQIGTGNNELYFQFDGDSVPSNIVLASGTDLDPRFIARNITERIHNLGRTESAYTQAHCTFENNRFRLYSGTLGSASSATVLSGTNTAHIELGWGTSTPYGGEETTNTPYAGGLTVSGSYNGFFPEEYKVVIGNSWTTAAPVKGGTNSYTGTITTGGMFNHPADITYTINILCTGYGQTMGGGSGEVPQMTWTTNGAADDSTFAVELLYPNHWYNLGSKGLMVKFTDALFNDCTGTSYAWTIACTAPVNAYNSNPTAALGNAQYMYGSNRGDDSNLVYNNTSATGFVPLGTRGLYIQWDTSGNVDAGDEFRILATGPQPKSEDITNLNYGNVTVSTEAPVKAVIFEIMSGAVEMSTVKFGLQSHGTFEHHTTGLGDTLFRFGTVGPGQPAGSDDGIEWWPNVTAADIGDDVAPSYLFSTKGDLSVVADADDSESIGASSFGGMTSDPIFLNIKLGASEVGANSTINYRIFFDYS